MLKSMTTFARHTFAGDDWSATMEMRSVNSRFFDANIRIPREFMPLEDRIRKYLKERLVRGRVDFSLQYESLEEIPVVFVPKIELARNYLHAVERLARGVQKSGDLEVRDLLPLLKDVITERKEEIDTGVVWERIAPVLENLLDSAMEMAKREGAATEEDIRSRLARIQKLAAAISEKTSENFDKQADTIRERIATLLKDISLDEARIAQEAAILADRLDINEELVRLESHISQFYKYLEMRDDVGRKLDFLVQEIFREANTMTSKSANTTISHFVVEIKGELEKIREQLQNVV